MKAVQRPVRISFLLLASWALLVGGLTVPVVRLEKGLTRETYSVIGGVRSLLESTDVLLALLVFAFSVFFPVAKLIVLSTAWIRRSAERGPALGWVVVLGKWSMLDVYVVVIFVGAMRLGILASATSMPGVYLFCGAVIGSTIAAKVVRSALAPEQGEIVPTPRLRAPRGRALSTAVAILFAGALSLPLMDVEKWIFWSSHYSLLASLGVMLEEGEITLVVLVAVFVVLVPVARVVAVLLARWRARPGPALLRGLAVLESWAMAEVFALALLVVVTKAGGDASVTPRAGMWCLVGAAVLSVADSWDLRRSLQRSERSDADAAGARV